MFTQAAFDSMRMAATLALAVPSLGARVSFPRGPEVEVSWVPRPLPTGVRHMAPCLFRRFVACAHHRRAAGHTVRLWGQPPGVDPTVHMLIAPGDRKLPSGIYQVQVDGGWRMVFPCLLSAPDCAETLAGGWPELTFHADPLTGVTLVACRRPFGEGPAVGRDVERLVDARARLLVAELLDGLAPAARS